MDSDMSNSEYPKITQEALQDAAKIILASLKNPEYLKGAPYSSLMLKVIQKVVDDFSAEIKEGAISSTGDNNSDAEANIIADIEKQFAQLGENLDQRSGEYQDSFRILVRVEKTLRTMPGVTEVVVDMASKSANIEAQDSVSEEVLTKTITDTGFQVVGIQ